MVKLKEEFIHIDYKIELRIPIDYQDLPDDNLYNLEFFLFI